ncbi:MAG TPA: hypothetical protein VGI92_13705 [Gemmatimonadales bacterium]|jgi:hypothetical protein
MPVTQAASDFGFLPIVAIWAFLMIVGKIQKAKKKSPPARIERVSAAAESMDDRQSGLMDELRNAMQELKAVETEATKQRHTIPARPAPASAPVDARSSAFARLQEMKAVAASRPAVAAWGSPITPAQPTAPTPAPAASPPGPLARYADSSLRGAFILSEILGRPRCETI